MMKELETLDLSKRYEPKYGVDWGKYWKFDEKILTLTYPEMEYEVDLETIISTGELCDWIFQIARKSWATEPVLHDFIQSLDWLLCPQHFYCSFGKSGTVKKADIRRIIARNLGRSPRS
jgi:hypothetical protein